LSILAKENKATRRRKKNRILLKTHIESGNNKQ